MLPVREGGVEGVEGARGGGGGVENGGDDEVDVVGDGREWSDAELVLRDERLGHQGAGRGLAEGGEGVGEGTAAEVNKLKVELVPT